MSGSANERANRAHQPPTAASDSTNTGADDVADTATQAGDATRHGGSATSDHTRSAPNGLHDSSADRGKTLAYPPNYSEREAGSAHDGADQPHPHGSDSSTGTRGQPLEPGADIAGEGDDRTGHPAERVPRTAQHRANRTRQRAYRASQRRKHSRDRSHNRSDDSRDTVAEPANEAEQDAASLPNGHDDTAPSSPSGPTDRSDHPTRRHGEPAPHASDGDRAGTSPASTGNQDTARDAADATGDLPNRGGDCASRASEREANTTGESSGRASDRSAELTETSSNGQQWTRRTAPYPSGRRRDAAGERKHSSAERTTPRPHGGCNPSSGSDECAERDEQK